MRDCGPLVPLLLGLLLFGSCGKEAPLLSDVRKVEQGKGWRGDGSGEFRSVQPPTRWSLDENVLWRASLPSWSNASPVPVGDRVFVCAEPASLLCLAAEDGQVLWHAANGYLDILGADERAEAERQIVAANATRNELQRAEQLLRRYQHQTKEKATDRAVVLTRTEMEAAVARLRERMGPALRFELPPTEIKHNGYSTPTPVTDGRRIFVLFGNGIAACYELEGRRVWARIVERPTADFGQSASPVLADGKLVVLIDALHALDASTGATLWKAPARQRWGTPLVAQVGADSMIVSAGGEIVRLSDGAVLSTKGGSLSESSAVVEGGVVYLIEKKAHAVRLSPSKKKNKVKREFVWNVDLPGKRYFASPIVHAGRVFGVSSDGDFSVLDAASGALLHERKLGDGKAQFYPSLTLAGENLHATSDDGTTYVLQVDKLDAPPVAVNHLEPLRSSLVFAEKRLYVRTLNALFCIGQ